MHMLRMSWFALFGVVLFVVMVPELRANPEWGPVQEFQRQHPNARELARAIQPVFERYYQAVAAGDNEAALAQYGWAEIDARNMSNAREGVLTGINFVKQQIEANGGVRQVGVVGVFSDGWVSDAHANIIVELEFNNGKKELSAEIQVERDGISTGSWKLKVERGSRGYVNQRPPIVGMIEVAKAAEAYYLAVIEGNVERAWELAYFGRLEAYQDPQEHVNRLERSINYIRTLVQANGGLVNFEVGIAASYVNARESYMSRRKVEEVVPNVNSVIIIQKYANGKTDEEQMDFILDEGRWKIKPYHFQG